MQTKQHNTCKKVSLQSLPSQIYSALLPMIELIMPMPMTGPFKDELNSYTNPRF